VASKLSAGAQPSHHLATCNFISGRQKIGDSTSDGATLMKTLSFCVALLLLVIGKLSVSSPAADTGLANQTDAATHAMHDAAGGNAALNWQRPAKLKRTLGSTSGTLVIDAATVEFRPTKGDARRWPIAEIKTLDLRPRRLLLTGYERRGGLRLGTQSFRFDLGESMPASVATDLAVRVGKPTRNRNPETNAPAFGTVPAHHSTPRGGSNGTLRFRDEGVDYVTQRTNDSRSWRWADIQTVSNLDPYHLVLSGYLETYSFDLKQPLPREQYDRLSDEVYSHKTANLRSGGRIEP
jgi:hypothetical protein